MASPTQWMWVWLNSGSWWWTGRPGMLGFMGSQQVGHDWATELIWTELIAIWLVIDIIINILSNLEIFTKISYLGWHCLLQNINSIVYFLICLVNAVLCSSGIDCCCEELPFIHWWLALIFQNAIWNSRSPYHVCIRAQSHSALYDPMDCSLPGSSVHIIFQARVLEWVAIPFSKISSRSRNQTLISCISCIDRQILYHWATWEAKFLIR